MTEYTIDVPDMTCTGCEKIITDEVARLAGVSFVDADADAGHVLVECTPESKRRVRATIEGAGYAVSD